MTSARLRAITIQATIAISPVRFRLPDGRLCECVGWRTTNPAKDAEGKPIGIPTLVLELGEPIGALPTADPEPSPGVLARD